MKKLLLTGLLGLGLFCSCSNEDEPVNNNQQNEGAAYAQIMISVASSSTPGTRTTTTGNNGDPVDPTTEENYISKITIVLADANDIAQQIITPDMKSGGTDNTDRATEPFTVSAGSYKVYVLANYEDNKNNLSPIIIGSTNMKSDVFDIKGKLSEDNEFFMTNDTYPTLVNFDGTGNDDEVDDDGNPAGTGKKVHLVPATIERVVSKVTFDNNNNEEFTVKEGTTEIAKAVLNSVAIINLNKKMFLVKDKITDLTVTSPWNGYYYVKDPNYTQQTDLSDFDKQTAGDGDFAAPNTAVFYCPENTMQADAQRNGETTGVVYKVTYTPDATNGFSKLDKAGSDSYSKKFAELLNLSDRNAAIAESMFTDDLESGTEAGSFYEYKGLIFKNKNAAYLYCAIDKTPSAEASAINTAFAGYLTTAPTDVHLYKAGVCYYTAWIKHNPNGGNMEQGKYGTVRNHWYELKVTGINALGHYEPTYKDAEDPDDPAKATIQVLATIKKWVLVKQDVTLE